ncbi:hypothetical protein TOPH_02087 [Tolypocladium ophioglossoides CBS 100239]|uniref:Uncharacterized protein n=1 Tax=Tolypocladium ophioglossoides (strain CBS 100239) TaxID=1163406 RepID=A0A0L0NHV2_TOLOC|nr:hypothetical protein TOPH_02087 [Tolypocladium ophioglossoides CBS 100239]
MSKSSFKIQALALEDVPAVAQLSADAFATDRQTEMKGLGKEPFDMKYGLERMPPICDNSVFAWVHSSEPVWRMYEKSGFQIIRALDIDLDEYAPMPPPYEGPDAKWGHYVFRYMKYLPKKEWPNCRGWNGCVWLLVSKLYATLRNAGIGE